MASDIELFARLASDILKVNKAANQIPPEGLNAEKAGEKSEPDETGETAPETETEPPEAKTETTTEAKTETTTEAKTETTTEAKTTTTTEKEN